MAERGVIFDRKSAGIIIEEVRRLRGIPRDRTGTRLPYRPNSEGGDVKYRVKQVGGDAGGDPAGTYCSFTYDVYPWVTTWNPASPTGDTLATATALTGYGNRIAPWTMDTDASVGEGFFDGDTFILTWVDEHVADQLICTPDV